MKTLLPYITAVVVAAFTMASCETPGRSALAGSGAGAAIGGLLHGRGSDAMTGAAIGAGAGYLLGKIVQRDRYYDDDEGYYDDGYPIGRRTNRSGFVTSPYRPYNLIDVRGIPRGAKVVDPSTNRVFINP